jgi:hypothetical protein
MPTAKRLLQEQSAIIRILVLVTLILGSTFFIFFIGVLTAMPFFGTDVLTLLSEAGSFSKPQDIYLMKYFQVVSQLGVFILPSLLFPLFITPKIFNYLQLDKFPTMLAALATILLIFTILPGINWLIQINQSLSLPQWLSSIEAWMRQSEAEAARLTEAFVNTKTIWGLLFNLFMIGVLASIGEELLFRGILVRLLNDWFKNVHLAVIVSAVLFSMFHLQFFGFLPRLMLGIVFGYLFVWSGSLWLPILAHFVNNASAVIVYYMYNKGNVETPVEEFGATENTSLFVASILLSIGLLFIIYFKGKTKTVQILKD